MNLREGGEKKGGKSALPFYRGKKKKKRISPGREDGLQMLPKGKEEEGEKKLLYS